MMDPILSIGAGGFVEQRLIDSFARREKPILAICRSGIDVHDRGFECHIHTMRKVQDYAPHL